MKVLIIGDVYSMYVENFSKQLKEYDTSISLSAINIRAVTPAANKFENLFDNLYHLTSLSNKIIEKIPKLRGVIRKYKTSKTISIINRSLDGYDVILLHGFWESSLKLINEQLIINKQFIAGAFWGSDFYKRINALAMITALKKCDAVIISTRQMQSDIQKTFSIRTGKIHNCLFGLAPLDELYKLRNVSQSESKAIMDFPENAFVIVCGYNANPHQQHIEIINQLKAVQQRLPENTILVFPVTYGGPSKYISKIKQAASELKMKARFLEEFLDNTAVAHLRKATDMFIQVQTTDANSGSTQEHLFAQNVVITGSWLPYQKYKDDGVYFETIDDMQQLGNKMKEVICNFENCKMKAITQNTTDKFKQSLWSEAIKDWYRVLNLYKTKQVENGI